MTNKEFSPWTSKFNFCAFTICVSDKDWVIARNGNKNMKLVRFFQTMITDLVFHHQSHLNNYKDCLAEFVAVTNYKQKELYAGSTLWNFQNEFSEKVCRIHADLFISKQEKVTLDHTYPQSMVLTSLANEFWNKLISFDDFCRIMESKPRRVALVPTKYNSEVRKSQELFKDKFFTVGESEVYRVSGQIVSNNYDVNEFGLLISKILDSGLAPGEVIENITYNLQLETGNFSKVGAGKRKEVTAYIVGKLKESFESNNQSKLKYCA